MPSIDSGVIVLWSGSIASIPAGWLICDGTNGTPDLRDRFLLGAGGAFAVGATGGSDTHTHPFTSDGHSHTFDFGTELNAGTDLDTPTDSSTDSGTTDSASNLPTYYALAFIMKS